MITQNTIQQATHCCWWFSLNLELFLVKQTTVNLHFLVWIGITSWVEHVLSPRVEKNLDPGTILGRRLVPGEENNGRCHHVESQTKNKNIRFPEINFIQSLQYTCTCTVPAILIEGFIIQESRRPVTADSHGPGPGFCNCAQCAGAACLKPRQVRWSVLSSFGTVEEKSAFSSFCYTTRTVGVVLYLFEKVALWVWERCKERYFVIVRAYRHAVSSPW